MQQRAVKDAEAVTFLVLRPDPGPKYMWNSVLTEDIYMQTKFATLGLELPRESATIKFPYSWEERIFNFEAGFEGKPGFNLIYPDKRSEGQDPTDWEELQQKSYYHEGKFRGDGACARFFLGLGCPRRCVGGAGWSPTKSYWHRFRVWLRWAWWDYCGCCPQRCCRLHAGEAGYV